MIADLPANGHRLWHARRGELTLLFGLISLSTAIALFLKFASEVTEGDTLFLDRIILESLRQPTDLSVPVGPPWLTRFMIDITSLGSASVLVTIVLIVLGYLLSRGNVERAAVTVLATSVGYALSATLKSAFSRPRPDVVPHLVDVTTASFPSGHAMNSAVVYLTLAAMVAQSERSNRVRVYILGAGLCLTGLIGISRVFLGVHWPTDVVAGWAVGATWAAACLTADYGFKHRSSGFGR